MFGRFQFLRFYKIFDVALDNFASLFYYLLIFYKSVYFIVIFYSHCLVSFYSHCLVIVYSHFLVIFYSNFLW